jgi:septal ring factor EnvC (AmiA/AmiB activator)
MEKYWNNRLSLLHDMSCQINESDLKEVFEQALDSKFIEIDKRLESIQQDTLNINNNLKESHINLLEVNTILDKINESLANIEKNLIEINLSLI